MTPLLYFVQYPFAVVSLAAQLVLGVGGPPEARQPVANVKFETPSSGSWVVAKTCDLIAWECVGSGHVYSTSHVSVRVDTDGRCAFYAVGFIAH